MNAFKIALILLALILLLSGINTLLVQQAAESLQPLIAHPEDFLYRWKAVRPYLSLTVNEDYLYAVDNTLAMLIAYTNAGEAAESASARNQLQLALERIHKSELLILMNIL